MDYKNFLSNPYISTDSKSTGPQSSPDPIYSTKVSKLLTLRDHDPWPI
jgi:hypothetical protein